MVAVTTLTKTVISRSEIIVPRRLHTLSTRLETHYTTSYLRTLLDGVMSVYRESLPRFGTTFILTHTQKWTSNINNIAFPSQDKIINFLWYVESLFYHVSGLFSKMKNCMFNSLYISEIPTLFLQGLNSFSTLTTPFYIFFWNENP